MPRPKLFDFKLEGRKSQDENEFAYSYDELSTIDVDDSADFNEPVVVPRPTSNYFLDAIALVAEGNRCISAFYCSLIHVTKPRDPQSITPAL